MQELKHMGKSECDKSDERGGLRNFYQTSDTIDSEILNNADFLRLLDYYGL